MSEVAQIAFRALGDIQAARTLSDLEDAIAAPLRGLGFEAAVGVDVASGWGEPLVVSHSFGRVLPEWSAFSPMGENDPRYSEVRRSALPFLWSSLPRLRALSAAEIEMVQNVKSSGVRDVLTLPDHRSGRIGAVHLVSIKGEIADSDNLTAAIVVGTFFGSFARRLLAESVAPPSPGKPPLTARQVECLRWVSRGKSASDIGQIIGISKRTVEEHLTIVCERLGVRTRVQAVAVAMLRRII